jgi:hypothetical protein
VLGPRSFTLPYVFLELLLLLSAFCFRLATSFVVRAFRSCMVRIKFTAHPHTPIVSPKFGSMASDEVLEASVEHKEISTEQLEESQGV